MAKPHRILVIDDQTLVRQGIISLLSLAPELQVVAEAANGADIVALVQQHQIDVVLMDIQMPQVNGIEALKLLRQAQLVTPVIILTTFDDNQQVLQAMQAGAHGYLLKDVALTTLVDAIAQVAAGGRLHQPAITDRIIQAFQNPNNEFSADGQNRPSNVANHHEALSNKELEVLRLMASGFSNREIADAVFKSEGTVKNQVSAILSKLGVRDRTKAVLKAIDLGLLH
jgi:DNA-binding NarL/FixJ family response regulator